MGWGPNAAKRRRHQGTGGKLRALLERSIPKVTDALDGLADAELVRLAAIELSGQARKGIADAIETEQGVRALSEGE